MENLYSFFFLVFNYQIGNVGTKKNFMLKYFYSFFFMFVDYRV